jgi:hypothetical protein
MSMLLARRCSVAMTPAILGLLLLATVPARGQPYTLIMAPETELDDLYAAYRPLLAHELEARQVDDPADLYKFLYQAVMGPAHTGLTEEGARAWLDEEWEEMAREPTPPSDRWPLWESLRPDGQLGRLHLRPLRRLLAEEMPAGQRPAVEAAARERLAGAFARTAEQWRPQPRVLRGLWARIAADESLWSSRFSPAQLARLSSQLDAAGWPAVHHAESYRERWRPHYRVVAEVLLPAAWRRSAAPADTTESKP